MPQELNKELQEIRREIREIKAVLLLNKRQVQKYNKFHSKTYQDILEESSKVWSSDNELDDQLYKIREEMNKLKRMLFDMAK